VRVARVSVLAALAGCIAILLPAHGLSKPSAPRACLLGDVSGLEAVFGRTTTQAQATDLQQKVRARGFLNTMILNDCPGFKLVLRGIDTFDVAVAFQAEARKEGFFVTLECIKGQPIGRLEAIFGHGIDRNTANAIVTRAAAAGFIGLKLRNDPCGGFEVYVAGFKDAAEAQTFRDNAKARGFNVAIESN
jgi:hypothetical protein